MKTFAEIQQELTAVPFHPSLVEFKPGPGNGTDKIALAYVTWTEYAKRLDQVAPGQWSVTKPVVTPAGGELVTVALEVTIVDEDTKLGFVGISDAKPGTQAFDQAFKRACALFGLGRYLYEMPNTTWLPFDAKKGRFDSEMFLPTAISCYEQLGLMVQFPGVTAPPAGAQSAQARPARAQATQSGGGFQKPTEKMVKSIIWRAETAGITDTSFAHTLTGAQAKAILDRNSKGEDMVAILDDLLGVASVEDSW